MANRERLLEIVDSTNATDDELSVLRRLIQTTSESRIRAARIYDQVQASIEENPGLELESRYEWMRKRNDETRAEDKLKAIDVISRSLKISDENTLPIDVIADVLSFAGLNSFPLRELVWQMISCNDLELTPERNFKLVTHSEPDK